MSKQAEANQTPNPLPHNTEGPRPDDPTLPPPYSGPAGSTSSLIFRPEAVPGLPSLHWSDYRTPSATADGRDSTAILVSDPRVTSMLPEFTKFINQQAALPPKQAIRIIGTHQRHGSTDTDFDFRINMLRYFLPKPDEHALNYVRLPTIAAGSLNTYARAFLQESARPKQFTLIRSTSNWDREYLSGRIHTLLANLNYRGKIAVEFPSTHSKVIINTEPKSIASTFRSFFADPTEYKIEAMWPYANFPSGGEADTRDVPRRCLVRSEEGWWRDWQEVIKFAVLDKRKNQTWIGLDDWMEVAMTPPLSLKQPRPWGVDE